MRFLNTHAIGRRLLNSTHPLASRVVTAYPFRLHTGERMVEVGICGGPLNADRVGTSGKWVTSQIGPGWSYGGTNGNTHRAPLNGLNTFVGSIWTWLAVVRQSYTADRGIVSAFGSTLGLRWCGLYVTSTTNRLAWFNYDQSSGYRESILTDASLFDGTLWLLAGSSDVGANTIALRAVRVWGTTILSHSLGVPSVEKPAAEYIQLGSYDQASPKTFNGDLFMAAVLKGAVSDAELIGLAANPNGLFVESQRRVRTDEVSQPPWTITAPRLRPRAFAPGLGR